MKPYTQHSQFSALSEPSSDVSVTQYSTKLITSQWPLQLVIRRKNLPKLLDISSSTLDGLLNPKSPYYEPDFPSPIELGRRSKVWLLQDILEYLECKKKVKTPFSEDSSPAYS